MYAATDSLSENDLCSIELYCSKALLLKLGSSSSIQGLNSEPKLKSVENCTS